MIINLIQFYRSKVFLLNFSTRTFLTYHYYYGWYYNLIICKTMEKMWFRFQFYNIQGIWKLCILDLDTFWIDLLKRDLEIWSSVTDISAVFCLGLYSVLWNIRRRKKTYSFIRTSLFRIIIAISLFDPIKARIVPLNSKFVYFGTV